LLKGLKEMSLKTCVMCQQKVNKVAEDGLCEECELYWCVIMGTEDEDKLTPEQQQIVADRDEGGKFDKQVSEAFEKAGYS
jgi:hypothetical protein